MRPTFKQKTLRLPSLAALAFSALLGFSQVSANVEPTTTILHDKTTQKWQKERVDYQLARQALEDKDFVEYLRLRDSLSHYPLYPYLESTYLSRNLDKVNVAAIQNFFSQYSDTPLAAPLKHRWLRNLAKKKQWQQFESQFDSSVKSAELNCYALWAKHKNGATQQALELTPNLWLVGHSQSDACNPIFDLWVKNGHLTDEMAWQRFQLAMRAGNTTLARYLIRFMSPQNEQLAKLYRDVYLNPEKLEQTTHFRAYNDVHRDIIYEGFKRLARRDSLLAWELWPEYLTRQAFHPREVSEIYRLTMLWLAHQDNSLTYLKAIQTHQPRVTPEILEAGIRMSIREQNWASVISLTNQLPEQKQQSTQAQYWLIRAQLETGKITQQAARPQLEAIAQQRDYYSFLAADHLQQPYRMNHKSYAIDGNFLERFKVLPAIVRASELLAAGQSTEARREWYRATRGFNADQHYAAAHFAKQLHWHDQAIRSAIAAKRWDDLELRFPLAHEEAMEHAAQERQLNSNWLMAMARQESAMTHDAVSHKNARGLIQMLPATARNVARKHNIHYKGQRDLFNPDKNIELASAYLTSLLDEFEGNDIYATAAYNAGPHRVEKWLKTTNQLPIDVWIESIPFHETRQYVKNVLTYSAVYAHRRNQLGAQMATIHYQKPVQ